MSARDWLGRRRAPLPTRRYALRWCWRAYGAEHVLVDYVDAETVDDATAALRRRVRRTRPIAIRMASGEVAVLEACEVAT